MGVLEFYTLLMMLLLHGLAVYAKDRRSKVTVRAVLVSRQKGQLQTPGKKHDQSLDLQMQTLRGTIK